MGNISKKLFLGLGVRAIINVKRHELKNSFFEHYKNSEVAKGERKNSHRLLLFYAVECGLKVLLLMKISKNTTADIQEFKGIGYKLSGKNGHNIKEILKLLGFTQFRLPSLNCKNGDFAACQEYNQIWRYGAECDTNVESRILEELDEIAQLIARRI